MYHRNCQGTGPWITQASSNSNWAAFGSLRYIWTDLEVRQVENDGTATFDFDTLSFTVGLAVRF